MARTTRYTAEIDVAAAAAELDPLLVEAVVVQESAGNTDAFRFEPQWWNRYLKRDPKSAGLNPRRVSSSYGLMQVMFPVAAERGYKGTPEGLFVPAVGLQWGCAHLAYLQSWSRTFDVPVAQQLQAMVASYNGGRGGNNPVTDHPLRSAGYARSVLAIRATLSTNHA